MTSKKELLETIDEYSFAMDEIRLFLDTHPNDKTALSYFTAFMAKREEAVKEYTSFYGSIISYYVNTDKGWTWEGNEVWKGEN